VDRSGKSEQGGGEEKAKPGESARTHALQELIAEAPPRFS
jgi:hypothetical protein